MGNPGSARTTAARAFLRSLNILLKFARMYDFGHPRTTAQFETAWSEFSAALGGGEEQGSLLLAVSGEQLLLDGVPLEASAAEKSFAQMLSSAGIASLHFSPKATKASLAKFVRAFPTGANVKPGQVAEQLKAALQDDPHIQVNEVCYVPADSAVAKSTVAAQLAARTLGLNSEKTDEIFSNPEKLLQLIVAAEGTKRSGKGAAKRSPAGTDVNNAQESGGATDENFGPFYAAEDPNLIVKTGSTYEWAGPSGEPVLQGAAADSDSASGDFNSWNNAEGNAETTAPANTTPGGVTLRAGNIILKKSELQGILHVLAKLGKNDQSGERKLDASEVRSKLAALPQQSQFTVSQVLSALAAHAPAEAQDGPGLLKLAEHIAVRFALDSYERGDTQVNTVQQTLNDMNQELEGLHKVLGVYEEKMTEAGIGVQSQNEVLAQRFWAQVPEEKRKAVLESDEAWCVPASRVVEYVEELREKKQQDAAGQILRNYANCVRSKVAEHRRQAATGLAELAPVFAAGDQRLFLETIRTIGTQIAEESEESLQSLASAAFVRMAQEAIRLRAYPAVQRVVEMIDYVDGEQPNAAKNLRSRVRVESRLSEFIDEALKNSHTPSALTYVLRRMPSVASEQIAARFGRAVLVEDAESLLWMMEVLGPEAAEHLSARFAQGQPNEAVETIGLLTRIDFAGMEKLLPARLKEWPRVAHDRAIRQIVISGAPQRGKLLLSLLDCVDPLFRGAVIDEIGISGELSAEMVLLRMAEGHLPKDGSEYLQIKAIEALGRLRTTGAEAVLRKIAEARKTFRWAHAYELRLVATQAMNGINPEWVRSFIPHSELTVSDLMIEPLSADPASLTVSQRRYERFRLDPAVPAQTLNLKKNCHLDVREMSLSGGMAVPEHTLHPGSVVELRLNPSSGKPIRMHTIIRTAGPQVATFEIVDIAIEERTKLRRVLAQQAGNAPKRSAAEEQNEPSPQAVSPTST